MARALRLVLWTVTVSLLAAAAPRAVAPRPSRGGGPGNTAAAAAATKAAGPAGAPTTAPAAVVTAPSFDEVPLFRLGGTAGLPAYLKASATTLADEAGLSATGEIRTVANDFATRDFTFDLEYRGGQPGERSHFPVGIGGEDFRVYSHVHGPGYNGSNGFGSASTLTSGAYADDFHTYAVEWEPQEMRFYRDGILYHTVKPALVKGTWVFEHPFYVILNLAVGGEWPGNTDAGTVFPQQMLVDYVRVYKRTN